MSLELRPVTLAEARRFIGVHHRHNGPPHAWLIGTSVYDGEQLVGVGVLARPARGLQDGFTAEIVRTCTDGTRNANSLLYGALTRAAFAIGYRRAVTYTTEGEPGSSLLAAGFRLDAELPPRGGWDCPSRPRVEVDLFGERRTPFGDARRRWVREAR